MDELARKYVETHDRKIVDELYELGREPEEMEKLEKAMKARLRPWPLMPRFRFGF
jgi:hypothetical protein